MHSHHALAAARTIWEAWTGERRIAVLTGDECPVTPADGWQIQRCLDPLAGTRVGWKIAGTSAAGRHHIGIERPIVGALYADRVFTTGAQVPWRSMHVIEPEFAFRMARRLPARDTPYTPDEVVAAVESLHPAIEIPDSRFTDYLAAGAAQLIAEDACAAYAVIGPAAADWDPATLVDHEVVVHRNGTPVATGRGANVLAGPIDALTWLANELVGFGAVLDAGDVVITGACAVPQDVQPGDDVMVDFGHLGRVAVSIR